MVERPECLPGVDDRGFVAFRATVLTALTCQRELHRTAVFLSGAAGFRIMPVAGVSRVLDLSSWLLTRSEALTRAEPTAAALVVPTSPDGTLLSAPAAGGCDDYDLKVWVVDDRRRHEGSVLRCRVDEGRLRRLPWRAGKPCAADEAALVLGALLSEPQQGPPAAPLWRLPTAFAVAA